MNSLTLNISSAVQAVVKMETVALSEIEGVQAE
jgi:hypothetical protein